MFAVAGMLIFPISNNLLLMFVALEVLSLPLYLMAGLSRRRRLLSQEAALKYFLLGAFASAFFLYGLALLYGYANSVDLPAILSASKSSAKSDVLLYAGLATAAGRAAVQGRHRAVPQLDAGRLPGLADAGDRVHGVVHQGRGVRRDPAGALRRLQRHGLELAADRVGAWPSRRWRSARIFGLTQTDIKRILAYSSIAHAGFILVGLVALDKDGISSVLFYVAHLRLHHDGRVRRAHAGARRRR